jgi:polysaccharide export outer membrane protein
VVQGEVGGPGCFQVASDRFTLIEALTLAGDLKPTSRRDNILKIVILSKVLS